MTNREKQRRAADKLTEIVVDCALTNANRTIAELIEACEYLMDWQVKHVDKWHNDAYDTASKLIKRIKNEGKTNGPT